MSSASALLHASDPAPIFAALGDGTRLSLLAKLSDGQAHSIVKLSADSALTRQAITKHLRVLEDAGLIRQGRDAQRRPRALVVGGPLQAADAWLAPFREQWEARFDRLEAVLEKKPRANKKGK